MPDATIPLRIRATDTDHGNVYRLQGFLDGGWLNLSNILDSSLFNKLSKEGIIVVTDSRGLK